MLIIPNAYTVNILIHVSEQITLLYLSSTIVLCIFVKAKMFLQFLSAL